MIAQAMRAVLFATAIATTLAGFFTSNFAIQGYFPGCSRAWRTTAVAPRTSRRRRYRSPCFDMPPSLSLPPVEFCRGTRPIQAARSRPDLNALGSVMVAAIAVAPMMPIDFLTRDERGNPTGAIVAVHLNFSRLAKPRTAAARFRRPGWVFPKTGSARCDRRRTPANPAPRP
jgi:hypothetical protein